LSAVTVDMDGACYRAVFTSPAGSAISDPATLTVADPPHVTVQPDNGTAVVGEPASFIADASGSPDPAVQWQVSTHSGASWNTIGGGSDGTLVIASAGANQNGNQYRAVFTNSSGTATSNAATLTVIDLPTIETQPESQTVAEGATVTFTAEASVTVGAAA